MCSIVQCLLLFISMCLVLKGGFSCEIEWLQFDNLCLRINQNAETYWAAKSKCKENGGDLVLIKDEDMLQFIKLQAANVGVHKFWVGVPSNTTGIQSFLSLDDDDYTLSWIFCFVYDGMHVIRRSCLQRLASVCSQSNPPSRNSLHCGYHMDTDFVFEGKSGRCIFSKSSTSYNNVRQECRDSNGEFISFDNFMKEDFAAIYDYKVLGPTQLYRFWTDLKWNGTHVLRSSGKPIDQDFPIPFIKASGSCVSVEFNFTDMLKARLYQTKCELPVRVICMEKQQFFTNQSLAVTPSSGQYQNDKADLIQSLRTNNDVLSCPDGYNWKSDSKTGFCYWETSFETERLSWKEAEAYCQGYGGHLASFHSTDEEKIGLSFQYGSLAHAYWFGLALDPKTETYKWSDGTALDYTNWAPAHPNHQDKRLRCVAMEAQEAHWVSSLCGILSWFICKVPKVLNPPSPVLPTPTPLQVCDRDVSGIGESYKSYVFNGSCYFVMTDTVSWHRAKQYCENQGYTLVSIHSDEEIGFLLKLLYEQTLEGTRVWIGLNTLGSDGSLQWTDYSPLDFTYFNKNEPNNYENQEKCCNMYIGNGLWNDENCNAPMGFICKRPNDTTSTTQAPSTTDPRIGNCKKGWIDHYDRCYLLGGIQKPDRRNWTEARQICQDHGGYLTSVRDENDQAFLAFLLQTLKTDAWIGLHDTIQSGRYYWLDNSDLQYTRWSPGEPSFFGIKEDCVMMVYNQLESGMWTDEDCDTKNGYICQRKKDPKLPQPSYNRGINCLHPEGWLKLDNMCFKMFEGNDLTWAEAENSCKRDGGHLVSVFDKSVRAVTMYLSSAVNRPFWIGLRYKESTQSLFWLNGWPMTISKWEKGEPAHLKEDTCFASTSEGYWKKANCDEQMPYVCQITTGTSPKKATYTGSCPTSAKQWIPASDSYCYIFDQTYSTNYFSAILICYRYGTHLISIHSLEQLEALKAIMKPGISSVRIGLMTSPKGGFVWTDDSPVDFVNWAYGEPDLTSGDECVEMMSDTMKWRVTTCTSRKSFICQNFKSQLTYGDPEKAKLVNEEGANLSASTVAIIVVCVVVFIFIILAAVFYYRRNSNSRHLWHPFRQLSFENAIYNVNSASMEFNPDDRRT